MSGTVMPMWLSARGVVGTQGTMGAMGADGTAADMRDSCMELTYQDAQAS
jgi:hypothetical protein